MATELFLILPPNHGRVRPPSAPLSQERVKFNANTKPSLLAQFKKKKKGASLLEGIIPRHSHFAQEEEEILRTWYQHPVLGVPASKQAGIGRLPLSTASMCLVWFS